MATATEALLTESAAAGKGVVRLTLFDERWVEGFDVSALGFLRSFIAPLLALPLYLSVAAALAEKLEGINSDADTLAAAALAHLLKVFGFPLLLALLARPLGFSGGFSAFVVVTNWASLVLNALLAVAALAVFAGPSGITLFRASALMLLALSVFVTWRAARETLTRELAPAMLVVVLSVAVSALSDEAAAWMIGQLAAG